MSDFHLVDPRDWEYDLQSVYSAYIGYFQLHGVPWHDRTWGQYFETFEQFIAFSWPVITVTDVRTGRAHIVTRMNSIIAFVKMIKTRFGEILPQVDNFLVVKPFETSQRHLRHVNDWVTYKKLHSALPAVVLAAFKARVRAGDPNVIRELWASRDKTFLAIDFESLERNDRSCFEWGYAAIRCGHLEALGAWPPVPNTNYRKGHYIVSEYADAFNRASPGASWQYAFGESQVIPKTKLPRIIQSVLSLVSPDSETTVNNVVLVGHGIQAILQRLDEMKIKLPNNLCTLDIAYLERALFNSGGRGPMHDRMTGKARLPESLLSLSALLRSLGIDPPCKLHNAGNDAFLILLAFQWMMDPKGTMGIMQTGLAVNTGLRTGNGTGKSEVYVKRAATVAARFFRPLGGNQNTELGTKGHGKSLPQMTVGRSGGGGADEMGMKMKMNAGMKRASVFGTLASPAMAPAERNDKNDKHDKHKKRMSVQVLNGDGSGNGDGDGSATGSVWWLPSTMQRRQSTILEKQR